MIEYIMRPPERAQVALRVLADIKAHVSVSEKDAFRLRFWVNAEEAMLPLEEIARLILHRESNAKAAKVG
jgi:hypothetical protein